VSGGGKGPGLRLDVALGELKEMYKKSGKVLRKFIRNRILS
jgi:hypothetical protein